MSVARTSGGKWDPGAPNIAFLAGDPKDQRAHSSDAILLALNIIGPSHMEELDRWCDQRRVLIDSGVYTTAANHARAHGISLTEAFALPPEELDGWAELYEKWCSIAVRFGDRIWGMIELDQGGAEAATATRAQLTRDTGMVPIPAFHPLSDPAGYFHDLAGAHDRICIGGLVGGVHAAARLRLCWTVAERARAYPHLWMHLLGVSPSPLLLSLGVRGSTDSSGWLRPTRWTHSWRTTALLAPISPMESGMAYRLDDAGHPERGQAKGRRLAGAAAVFGQATLAAAHIDTHPRLEPAA